MMERTQRELMHVLLGRIFSLGLISKHTYESAENLVFSKTAFPTLLHDSANPIKEAHRIERSQNSQ